MHVLLDAGAEDWILREGAGAACIDAVGPGEEGDGYGTGAPLRLRAGGPDDARGYRAFQAAGLALHVSLAVPVDAAHGLEVVCEGGRPVARMLRIERRR